MTSKQGIKDALGNVSDEELQPRYKTVYTPDSVDLESVESLLNKDSVDQADCLTILSNSCQALKADFNNYLLDSYQTLEYTADRLTYTDISNIARFVIWKFKSNDSVCLDKIFENAEIILEKGNEATRSLIIVGLFEDIQNIGGWHKVDYYKGFDQWLRPNSKKAWKEVIDFWEKERK